MATPFAYVSLVTTGATSEGGARNFSYLRVLNTDIFTGGTATATATAPSFTLANSNNVSFTTIGSSVVASASYTWAHVAPARSAAWEELGVYVASGSPTNPCQYSQWVGGSSGFWGWIELP